MIQSKKNLATGITLAFLLFLTLANPRAVHADSYTIPVIKVEVQVLENGSIRITEHLRYEFDGSYSWADYRLPLEGYTGITNIQVTENGQSFINENSEEPGTFMVQRNDEQIRVKWFYEAEDETRTFSISYTLEEALVVGPQWVEFFWNYISSDREKDTDSLTVDFALPHPVAQDSIYFWKRGAIAHASLQYAGNGYELTATNLDDDQSVQVRTVFPRRMLNENQIETTNSDFTLAWAQDDEKAYQQEQAEQRRINQQYAAYGKQLTVIISLLSILAFVLLYQKYGKRHSARGVSSTETIMIPGRLEPAVAGWLLNSRSISSGLLMATLLDLARRNYFVIEEQEPEEQWLGSDKKRFKLKKSDERPTDDALTDWELDMKTFVDEQIDDENTELEKLFSASSVSASSWFSDWKKKLKNFCQAKSWYDEKSYKGVYLNVGIQFILLCLAVLAFVWAGPAGLIGLFVSALMLLGSFTIIRRTEKGEQAYAQWNAYKKGLKNAKDHTIKTELLDKHFIYAIAFGLPKDDIKTVFNQCDGSQIAFYWFIFYGGHPHSAANIADTFTNLGASGAAAFPGATGGTAGATAGSAGGGAAASAG